MKPPITIIIPTFSNPEFLNPCINSIAMTGALTGLAKLLIINNGQQPIKDHVAHFPNTEVLEPGANLGWERGLQYGLERSESEFVCFQNDDTHIARANMRFYEQLLIPFSNTNVAAVGPTTTNAAGWHSIYRQDQLLHSMEVSYLIFFTVMMRREDLMRAGGIDVTAPGGDDLDLSIRLRKMGKKLVVTPDAFIIHHGFKTGERVRGGPTVAGGWNSKEMSDRTNQWLIQKHGFKTYMQTVMGLDYSQNNGVQDDKEGNVVRSLIVGEKVIELGCGYTKTVPHAIGIDRAFPGEGAPHIAQIGCVADIQADVSKALPLPDLSQDVCIARHILEHIVDNIDTVRHWNRVLKLGGRLIIAVPDQRKWNTIPMNPEHVVAYTPTSLKSLLQVCGFQQISTHDPDNGISFVSCFEKVLHIYAESNGKVKELQNA